MKIVWALLAVITPALVVAQAPTLKELEKQESGQRLDALIKETEGVIEGLATKLRMDCMKAVGATTLCECLMNKLPQAWTFSDYVAILTRTKEENGYAKLAPDLRRAYDAVPQVRDSCVAGKAP